MSQTTYALMIDDDVVQIALLDAATPSPMSVDVAQLSHEAAVTKLREAADAQHPLERVLLVVPGRWCMCAKLNSDGMPIRRRISPDHRDLLTYRLEEKLPLAAEHMVADFIVAKHAVLGLALPVERLLPWVTAFDDLGVDVSGIVPAELLAMQHLLAHSEVSGYDHVLWSHRNEHHCFDVHDGRVADWRIVHGPVAAVMRHIHLTHDASDASSSWLTLHASAALVDALQESPHVTVVGSRAYPISDHLLSGCKAVADAAMQPWVDFDRPPLPVADRMKPLRSPLNAVLMTLMLLGVCLCGVMLWRAEQYEQIRHEYERRTASIFRATFPGQRPPTNVLARMNSEARIARALRGDGLASHSGELAATTRSALSLVYDTLSHLPEDQRLRLLFMQFSSTDLSWSGQARTHAEAEAICAAWRQLPYLDVDAAQTQRVSDQVVGFTVSARIKTDGRTTP